MSKKIQEITIGPDTKFLKLENNFLKTEVDGETVLMNTENGSYWGLNETTSTIWNFIKEEKSLRSIIDHLLEQYNISEEICKKETIGVLVGLYRHGIIQIK